MSVATRLQRALLGALSPGGSRARLMILMFHQVTPEPDPLAKDVPDAELFEAQMRWLADFCNVLPLPDAARRLAAGTLPPRAASITFDDGYANNLEVAAPILTRLGLPATFFVAGGAVDDGIMWNDLVIEAVRASGPDLDLRALGLDRFALDGVEARLGAIDTLLGALKYRPMSERLELAQDIFRRAGGTAGPRLMMTRAQVAELARGGFDIGAHTVRHPILATLADDEARAEIEGSRAWVADVTGAAPVSFAYPNGRPGRDYDARHVRMAGDVGFEVAVSTAWACAVKSSGALELPRFAPWERDRAGFWLRLVKTALLSYRSGVPAAPAPST